MLTNYTYNYRLEPRGNTLSVLSSVIGNQRYVWNWALARQKGEYERNGKKLTYNKLAHELTELKKGEGNFLKDGFSQSHQQTLKHLESAYSKFFKGTGLPRFKKRGKCRESFSLTNQQVKLDRDNGRISLPKVGWVSFRKDNRRIEGKVLNATVSRKNGKWNLSVVVEQELDVKPKLGTAVGIDLGIKNLATLSDGTKIKPLNAERGLSEKMANLQRSAARKIKGSENKKKDNKKIAKLSEKIANQRKDYIHKLTDSICKNHAVVVVEDLSPSRMSRSAKGTVEHPGRNVSAKRGLNRSIRDQSWGELLRQLDYKTARRGGKVIRVNPAYTSQTCSSCRFVSKENRKTQSKFLCVKCGYADNADVNAAKNILTAGLTSSTSGQEGMACGSNPDITGVGSRNFYGTVKSRRNPHL